MSGRGEKEAAETFLGYFQQSISCITPQALTAYQQSRKLYKVWLNPPAKLETQSGGKLVISITQVFGVGKDPSNPKRFKVKTREYSYVLYRTVKGSREEVLAYHWHPHDSDQYIPHTYM